MHDIKRIFFSDLPAHLARPVLPHDFTYYIKKVAPADNIIGRYWLLSCLIHTKLPTSLLVLLGDRYCAELNNADLMRMVR